MFLGIVPVYYYFIYLWKSPMTIGQS